MQFRDLLEGIKNLLTWWWCLFLCRI